MHIVKIFPDKLISCALSALASLFVLLPGVFAAPAQKLLSAPSGGSDTPTATESFSPTERADALDAALSDRSQSDAISRAVALLPSPPRMTPLNIQSANAPQFRSLILPEWYPFVRDGAIEIPAFKTSQLSFGDDADWVSRSMLKNEEQEAEVDLNVGALTRGFPFGDTAALQQLDSKQLAQRMLLNFQARELTSALVRAQFRIQLSHDYRLLQDARLTRIRVAPGRLDGAQVNDQLYREIAELISPEGLSGFRYLTFRFTGSEEDLLWLYSPRLNKVRQLTGSNRGDSIFGLSVSLDDLMPYSEKTELIDVQESESLVGLVPVADDTVQSLSSKLEGCLRTDGATGVEAIIPQAQPVSADQTLSEFSRSTLSSGFPSSVVFVPRPLRKIYLNPRDPFSPNGRMIIYIDEQLQMPVAKVVFDRTGQLSRLVLGALAISETKDGMRREPYFKYASLIEIKSGARVTLETESYEMCDALPKGMSLTAFDPSNLAPQRPAE